MWVDTGRFAVGLIPSIRVWVFQPKQEQGPAFFPSQCGNPGESELMDRRSGPDKRHGDHIDISRLNQKDFVNQDRC